jgi:radical SAM protein with 4Fe4S-binding SPASM domain
LLNKEISKRLILSGLTKITFSLDAFSDEVYRKTRKSKMYSRVVAKINEFLALKTKIGESLPLTKVTFIVMDENRHEVDEFGQYWKDRVDAVAIQGLINIDEKKEIARTVKDIGKYRCNMPYIRLTVKANGDVLPCCIYYGEDLPFGNVYRNTIAEVWNSSEFNEFQKMHKDYRWHDNLVCRKCVLNSAGLEK